MILSYSEGKSMSKLKIAVIPGDGIGWEVVPEGIKVLEAVGAKYLSLIHI